MARENTTRYIILGLLSHEDMSGYDMKKRIDMSISHFWPVGYGQIYPTLKALVADGLIQDVASVEDKGPPKTMYAITPVGKDSLKAWLAQPEQREYTRYEILLKLFFGAGGDVADAVSRIRHFMKRHERNAQTMGLYKKELAGIVDEDDDHLYYYLTVLFGESVYKAYVEWAQQALVLLNDTSRHKGDG